PMGLPSVPEDWWRQRFYDRTIDDGKADVSQNGKRMAFNRAVQDLADKRLVGVTMGVFGRADPHKHPHRKPHILMIDPHKRTSAKIPTPRTTRTSPRKGDVQGAGRGWPHIFRDGTGRGYCDRTT